jgi:prepilin-type N-terminal cleavage/methylation domain-containing protein
MMQGNRKAEEEKRRRGEKETIQNPKFQIQNLNDSMTRRPNNPTTHRGVTLTELLVAALLVSVLVAAAFGLFRTSWLSYQNLVWQSKVNMEARRTLDDICDHLRMGGVNGDLTAPMTTAPQVKPIEGNVFYGSSASQLEFTPIGSDPVFYRAYPHPRHGGSYLMRRAGGSMRSPANMVGQFVTDVSFEYEYRLPATNENDAVWRTVRVSNPGVGNNGFPNNSAAYLAHTVYVTVTSQVSPYGDGGQTYTRRLTSAVHLRGPFNSRIPPAKFALPSMP